MSKAQSGAVREYLAEIGRRGGSSRSAAKVAAVRQNIEAANARRQAERERKKLVEKLFEVSSK